MATCAEGNRRSLLEQTLALHGVAHFLFHAAHLHTKPAVAEACRTVAGEARRRGMQWWTSEQLNAWERGRRGVRLAVTGGGDSAYRVDVEAATAMKGTGILLAVPGLAERAGFRVTSGDATATVVTRHGRRLLELAADLPAGRSSFTVEAVGH